MDPRQSQPPDDHGSETFDRYCYQAHIALPLCIECASGSGVDEVFLEHFEDVVVHSVDGWRFLQIKTRDSGQRPWRLLDMVGSSGAFRSLARTSEALNGEDSCSFEAHLEGDIATSDPLKAFDARWRDQATIDERADYVRSELRMEAAAFDQFYPRLSVTANLPPRSHIDDLSLALLAKASPSSSIDVVKQVRDRVLGRLHDAMRAAASRASYPQWVLEPLTAGSTEAILETKRLVRAELESLFSPLALRPKATLLFPGGPIVGGSALKTKLQVGGAPPTILDDALMLRASASIREQELLQLGDDIAARLTDVQERVRLRGNAIGAKHATVARPAVAIWAELFSEFTTHKDTLDAHGLFDHSPELLLGELCEVSDTCRFEWGVSE